MRYPEEVRWTGRVRRALNDKYQIIEEGQNGRLLPSIPRDTGFLASITGSLLPGDTMFIMLGTNDVLLTDHPDADYAVKKMEDLLDWLLTNKSEVRPVVIGPVPISGAFEDMQIYHDESVRMNMGFEAACKERNIDYQDATDWGISMGFDGVHFSEEGCMRFAEKMLEIIMQDS